MTMGDSLLEATLGATVEHLKETRSAVKTVFDSWITIATGEEVGGIGPSRTSRLV